MKIHIENLSFTCIIGILDYERKNEQKVIINALIEYDFDDEYINYAQVVDFIKSIMIHQKFLLLEDAIQNISINLKNRFFQINTLYLKITKPSILPDCKVSVSDITNFQS